jgi:DHA2 family multidrug resistance protein
VLAGLADQTGDAVRAMIGSGMSQDAAVSHLNDMVQSQSVMIATNQLMLVMVLVFGIAALTIWLAPKPARAIDPAAAGGH